VVADLNGDGEADVALVYGNSGSQGVLVLIGLGNGSFQTPVTYPGSSSFTMLGAGDFTGGGKPDLALIDYTNRSIQLLRDSVPGLNLSSTHVASIWQGLIGASYVLTVTNNQATPVSGVVAVTDTLPTGLTATSISGSGWNCDLTRLTCTRSDSLASNSSYPPIILTFNTAVDAPVQVINYAFVSVGGSIAAIASDPTSIAGSLRATTTALTVSPNPASLGQAVTLTARVPAPTIGLVVFYDGASILGSSLIDITNSTATLTTTGLSAETHLLRAYFRETG
jgi:hypothetical protein